MAKKKPKNPGQRFHIVALYPSINRSLLKCAVIDALKTHSYLEQSLSKYFGRSHFILPG